MNHTCPYCGCEPTDIAGLSFNRGTGRISYNGASCRVTPREFEIVRELAAAGVRGCSKAALMTNLYEMDTNFSTPEAKILDVFTCKIRRTFRSANINLTIISNYERGGLEFARLFLVKDPPRPGASSSEVRRHDVSRMQQQRAA